MRGYYIFLFGLFFLMFTPKTFTQQRVIDLINNYRNANVVNFKIKSSEFNNLHGKIINFEYYFQIINKNPAKEELLNRADITLLNSDLNLLVYIPVDSQSYFYSHYNFFRDMKKQENWNKEEYLKTFDLPINTWNIIFYTPFESLMLNKKLSKKKLKIHNSGYIFDFRHSILKEKIRLFINNKTLLIDSIHFAKNEKKIYLDYYQYNDIQLNKSDVFPIDSNNNYLKSVFAKNALEAVQLIKQKDSIQTNFSPVGIFNKLTLLDFWFIGCSPCHKSFPSIEKIRNTYSDSILDIKAISYNNTQEEINNYKIRYGFTFDMLPDSNNFIIKFDVNAYPTKILITPEGDVLYRSKGNRYDIEESQYIIDIINQYLNTNK